MGDDLVYSCIGGANLVPSFNAPGYKNLGKITNPAEGLFKELVKSNDGGVASCTFKLPPKIK